MELLQLRYFQTVARMESITRAAAFYHIPQPAMSQTISRLEKELGCALFDRTHNRLYLNENGRRFLAYADRAMLELENGLQALSTRGGDISGPIRLIVLDNRRFTFNCVAKFSEQYPNVSFYVTHDYSAETYSDFDLCIYSNPGFRQMNACRQLIREEIVLNVHEQHPLASREEVDLYEFRNEKFITMSSHSSIYAITFEQCRKSGFEPHVPFICDDPYYVRKYVAQNMGVALSPSLSWAGRFRTNTKLLRFHTPRIFSASYLQWDERKYMPPAVQAFRDFLLSEASVLPGNTAE